MKLIHLRGTNATGKTTTMRQFILHGGFGVETIRVGTREVEYHWDGNRKIAVLGRYDLRTTGGIDGYITNKHELLNVIAKMMKAVRPETILFEGIVYGVTYQFGIELRDIARRYGYEYIGICLAPPLDVALERLAERNGGKPVDYMSVQNKWFTAESAYRRLRADGVNVKRIDTSDIPKDKMYTIIEDEL